eukprot:jgi/Ulvmu1/4630/UM002_0361.1
MVAKSPGRRVGDARSRRSPHVQTLGTGASRSQDVPATRLNNSKNWGERDVRFPGQNGKSLAGTIVQVKGGNKDMVILCHGFASHRNSFHFKPLAEALAHRHVGTLRIDFTGNGDSDGTFDFANYSVEAGDIRSAVQYLQSLGLNVTGIVGHSKGAGSVLLYSSLHDDIANVVNIAGRFDMHRGIKERFGEDIMARLASTNQIPMTSKRDDGTDINWVLTKWSLQDRLDLNMEQICARILCSEVCTVHGSADQVIPVDDARRFSAAVKNHRLHVIDGADHNFRRPEHAQQLIQAVVEHCCH